MIGFFGQKAASATTPAAVGDNIVTGRVFLKGLPGNGSDIVYFGYFANDTDAGTGLSSTTGYPLKADQEVEISVDELRVNPLGHASLAYLYIKASANTPGVAFRGS